MIVLEASLYTATDGGGVVWAGSLHSQRHPGLCQDISPTPPQATVSIDTTLAEGLVVTGGLYLRSWGTQWILWTDGLAWNFPGQVPQTVEGSLVSLGNVDGSWPPPPPTPPPPTPPPSTPPPPAPPIPPSQSSGEPVPVAILSPAEGRDGELFPYVYMRTWPEPSAEDVAIHFVVYPHPLGAPPSGPYFQKMAALARSGAADAREQMEQLSVTYLESLQLGRGASAAQAFLAAHGALPAALGAPSGPAPEGYATSADRQAFLVQAWQAYAALVVVLGYDSRLRDALGRLLVVDHTLAWISAHPGVEPPPGLAKATIVLPAGIFPLPPAGASPVVSPPASGDWITPYAIGDLQMVKQRLTGYALGDLARVESVMAGERRESVRRIASRVTESSTRKATDQSSRGLDARTETQSGTIGKAVADLVSTTTYGIPGGENDFKINYGTSSAPTTTLTGGWSLETKPGSSSPSQHEVTRAAQRLVEKAAQRVAREVVETRSAESSRESEESTTSTFDNTAGTTGRRGIYRWLNEVYQAYVVNYGNRLVFEMVLTAPGARYLREELDLSPASAPPVPPAALGIESYEDVSRHNFPLLAARYPSEALELPPPARRSVSGWAQSGEPLTLTLPEGYSAAGGEVRYVILEGSIQIEGFVGPATVQVPSASATGAFSLTADALKSSSGSVQILLQTTGPLASPPVDLEPVQLTVEIEAAPGESLMDAWRLRTYQAIQSAYAAELQVYQGNAPADAPAAPQPRLGYRAVERRELKKGAIGLLFQQLDERVGGAGADNPSSFTDAVDVARPRYLQFFERAFEWGEMSYSFIADAGDGLRGKRPSLTATGDDRFLSFLDAAYAQVLTPVSPSEALAVLYFLASGAIWDGDDAGTPVVESDLPLASELKRLRDLPREVRRVSEPWQVVVPTAIAVLEDGSALPWQSPPRRGNEVTPCPLPLSLRSPTSLRR